MHQRRQDSYVQSICLASAGIVANIEGISMRRNRQGLAGPQASRPFKVHRSMDHVIEDLNELCSKDIYLRFADDRIRLSRAFFHVLVLDGAEVAAATMCDTRQCPVCTCPHQELDRTDKSYPYRITQNVKAMVEAARREHLDDHGRVKPLHQT